MERTTKNSPHWIFYVIAALLALIAVLLVLLLLKPAASDPGSTGPNVGGLPADVTEGTDAPGIPLDGKWTTLYLPRELQDTVTPVRSETDSGVLLRFYAQIGEKNLELFSVELRRQTGEGYQLGILRDTLDGDIYVYTSVNEQSAQDWSAEDYSRINALQLRVNDFISQFYEDARFQAVH